MENSLCHFKACMTSTSPKMDTARLRKSFKFPSDDDGEMSHEEMDEEGTFESFSPICKVLSRVEHCEEIE